MNLLYANDARGAYPASYYAASAEALPEKPPLQGEVAADVCVVGGGYTGLSAALHLAGAGATVRVLEAQRLGFGASGRNGGQVGSGQRMEVDGLERIAGRDGARALWELGEAAKAKVRELVARHRIDCDWQDGIAHADLRARDVAHTHRLAETLTRDYGYPHVEPLDRDGIAALTGSEAFAGGALDRGAGHVHPLRLAFGLARAAEAAGAVLHEGSEALQVTPGPRPTVRTEGGRVTAGTVILAANGYLGRLEARTAARVMPINNFIVATEPLGARAPEILPGREAVADSRFVVNYWRLTPDRRLIFGGGESYGLRFPRDIAGLVRPRLLAIYPQLEGIRLTHAWGGTLAITKSRLPWFGRPAPGILSASGYSGHGVALATLAGALLAEAARGPSAGFDRMADLGVTPFPGGTALRAPLLRLAMGWFSLRDRLGV